KDGEPLMVLGDPCDLGRTILQLAKNAKEAFPADQKDKQLIVRARAEEDGQIRIEVSDNGPGIAPSIRDRLFQDFVTTKSSSERRALSSKTRTPGVASRLWYRPSRTSEI